MGQRIWKMNRGDHNCKKLLAKRCLMVPSTAQMTASASIWKEYKGKGNHKKNGVGRQSDRSVGVKQRSWILTIMRFERCTLGLILSSTRSKLRLQRMRFTQLNLEVMELRSSTMSTSSADMTTQRFQKLVHNHNSELKCLDAVLRH